MMHVYNLYAWNSVSWKILPAIKLQSSTPANPSIGQMYDNTIANSLNTGMVLHGKVRYLVKAFKISNHLVSSF